MLKKAYRIDFTQWWERKMWKRGKATAEALGQSGWSADQIARCHGLRTLHFELEAFSVTAEVEVAARFGLVPKVSAEVKGVCPLLRVPCSVIITHSDEEIVGGEQSAGRLFFSSSSPDHGRDDLWRPSIQLIIFDSDNALLSAVRNSFAASYVGGGSRPMIGARLRVPLHKPFGDVQPGHVVIEGRSGSDFELARASVFEHWGKWSEN